MKQILIFFTCLLSIQSMAQFPPAAGKPGSTAIHADSNVFVAWASACYVKRGWQDVSNQTLGYTTVGDSSSAVGKAGINGVVSLGDGGEAVLLFDAPVTNGSGWDFAVFENSFSDYFLELAFVEVSSDGINFFRFPSTSYTQTDVQVGTFDTLNPEKINNLAGKYRALYGTPFDLQELENTPGLNVNAITHVKIIDAIGSIQSLFATYDQYGNKVNDPWHTPFPSGGFDLDAVGVIHYLSTKIEETAPLFLVQMYPNPASHHITIRFNTAHEIDYIEVIDNIGRAENIFIIKQDKSEVLLDISTLKNGLYYLNIVSGNKIFNQKIIVNHE
ncbi:MAG: T9SS type A sorting domain-containing protein [Flavobacteriales bacterium]|nr:T9SS type A sorting domain-containing protein [Flavobacteriales bacterium]